MIGTNPNLPFPQLTDTYAQAVGKISAWLSAIGVSLADRATPSALNINTALDFGGNAATNITSLQLASGNTPNVPGSIFYYQGEFYAIDSTGAVQLTANGQLNAASIGGIGGDYGGVNPAKVSYDNASGQYRFYTNGGTGAWAELVAAKLLLEGAAGNVEFGVDAALAANRVINFKSLPASGVGLLVYNAATSTIEDASATPVTDAVTLGVVTTTGTLTTGGDHKHTDSWIRPVPLTAAARLTSLNYVSNQELLTSTGAGWQFNSVSHGAWGLRVGDRIKRLAANLPITHTGNYSFSVYKYDSAGNSTLIESFVVSGASGSINTGWNLTSPVAIAAGERWLVQVIGAASGDSMTDIHVEHDHP